MTVELLPLRGSFSATRIFTPGEELPMAGHPTIGTTFALAAEGVIARGRNDFVFELGVGPTPVSQEWSRDTLSFAWMTQRLPEFGGTITDRASLSAAIGLTAADLPDLPSQMVSCGVPFLFVPLASRQAVDAVTIDRKALTHCCREAGIEMLPTFFFTTEGQAEKEVLQTIYSRMLAPSFGIAEDPATGGASGPLGCYLLHHKIVTGDCTQHPQLAGCADEAPEPHSHCHRQSRRRDHARPRGWPVGHGGTRRTERAVRS